MVVSSSEAENQTHPTQYTHVHNGDLKALGFFHTLHRLPTVNEQMEPTDDIRSSLRSSPTESSTSMPAGENVGDTGVLLYETDKDLYPCVKSDKECMDQRSLSEKIRHCSAEDQRLARVRHASYEGPASTVERQELCVYETHAIKCLPENESQSSTSSNNDPCDTCFSISALVILLLANTLNYMDRYTIAGVLVDIKDYYSIDNGQAGLLQTSFIVIYMLFSPLFGYLGDRYNRKMLMSSCIFLWSLITLAGSFVPADKYWLFVVMRSLVGIGEASYSTIAPTIIADMFAKDNRSKALAVFFFAVPVGSGLGYIVGSAVAGIMGSWQWALRVTPPFGILCSLLMLVLVREPERGASDGAHSLEASTSFKGYIEDLTYLLRNKSFVSSTLGFTCVAFVAGALSFWGPTFVGYAIHSQGNGPGDMQEVALIFGVVTCLAGFLGVLIGSESARRLRVRFKSADPVVCAVGQLIAAVCLFAAMISSHYHTSITWVLIFIGETGLCFNWAIVTDILLYTVVPTRRSSAEALQILVCHLLGDAGSPYLIGVISDSIEVAPNDILNDYLSLQYALFITVFVCVLGVGFFLFTSVYVVSDKAKADKFIKESTKASELEEMPSKETAIVVGDVTTSLQSFA